MTSLLIVVALIVLALVIGRLVIGLIRWVLIIALGAFLVFFLLQPTSTPPTVRAHVAAHTVMVRGQAVTHAMTPRWKQLWYAVTHGNGS